MDGPTPSFSYKGLVMGITVSPLYFRKMGIKRPQLKSLIRYKGVGTCKVGERADLTGCIPATPNGGGGPTYTPY